MENKRVCHIYEASQAKNVRIGYTIITILYLIGVYYFQFHISKASFILVIPLIVFGIGMWNATNLSEEDEDDMFKASYLSVGVILVMPLLSWMNKDYEGDVHQFVSVIGLAMVFTLLTLIDVWFPRNHRSLYRHIRSSFQTISVTLILFAFSSYFIHRKKGRLQ